MSKQATASALSPLKLSLLAALIVGIIGGFIPEILGLGTEIVQKTLRLDYSVPFGVSVVLKISPPLYALALVCLVAYFHQHCLSVPLLEH